MIIFSALILATILEQCVCSYNNPDEVSIGFALNFDYGTATLSYPNGTLFEIAKVYSTADYQNTIRKLSNWSAAHFAYAIFTPLTEIH
jgi:long-subunit fatty acid transport protein